MVAPRLLYIARLSPDPTWHIDAHLHKHHELIVVLGGRLRVRIDGELREARTGDLLLYHAGHKHEESTDPADPVETIFLGFAAPDLNALPGLQHDDEGRVREMVRWLLEDCRSFAPVPAAQTAADALLNCVLVELRRIHRHPVREAKLVASTHAYIRLHLTEDLTLDRLARNAGLSKYYFNRLFHKLAKRTPLAAVREIRLNYARDLVLSTNLPLKSIAPKAGFTDEYQLSRNFRRYHGLSPGSLRRLARWG